MVRVDNLRKFVVTAMNEQRLIEPLGGGSVQTKIMELVKKRDISWNSFIQEVSSPLHAGDTLETILKGAQSLTPLSVREYLFNKPREFALVMAITICLTTLLLLGCTIICVVKKRRAEKDRREDITGYAAEQTAKELEELKRRLSKSEENCRNISKQMQEIGRFREAISSDLFRQYLRTSGRSLEEGIGGRSNRRANRENEMANQMEMQPLM